MIQDTSIALFDYGVWVIRDGTDTVPGFNTTTQKIPRLSYFIGDNTIISMNGGPPGTQVGGQFGWVRALKAGSTTITAIGYGDTISFPVTVIARPPTAVIARVLSSPRGDLIPVAQRTDTGTFYAYPADRLTSRLESLILDGNDTLQCGYCPVKTAAQGGPRIMRPIEWRSTDTTKLIVNNSLNPWNQRATQTATITNTDTAGYVTVRDTSSTPVPVVMYVPGDDLADTVWLKLALRPIDTLRVRPDSNNFPPTGINQIGTVRRIYPNSDTLAGNVVASSTLNFIAGIDYLWWVRNTLPVSGTTSTITTRWGVARPTGGVTVFRAVLPLVTWQSALPSYLSITPIDVAKGAIVAPCAFIGGACPAATRNANQGGTGTAAVRTQIARDSLVINCNDNNGNKLPGTLANGQPAATPIAFNGDGNYTIPSCVPAKSIPMPGAFCTSASATDNASMCSIWIRATATDPATGKLLRDNYRMNVTVAR